jgi:hypothetical protein
MLNGGKGTVTVNWAKVDDDERGKEADRLYDEWREFWLGVLERPVSSELKSEKKIELGGRPGREIEIKKTGLDTGAAVLTDWVGVFRGRCFLVGDHKYSVHAIGKPDFAGSMAVTRILESLKLSE